MLLDVTHWPFHWSAKFSYETQSTHMVFPTIVGSWCSLARFCFAYTSEYSQFAVHCRNPCYSISCLYLHVSVSHTSLLHVFRLNFTFWGFLQCLNTIPSATFLTLTHEKKWFYCILLEKWCRASSCAHSSTFKKSQLSWHQRPHFLEM